MPKSTKFIFAIGLQIAIIFTIIIFKLLVLGTGTEVLLSVQPVDPTSPLRGDYVAFQYDISNIAKYLNYQIKPKNGDTVYVVLHQNGKYWIANTTQLNKPTTSGTIFIKGKVVSG